ncbi:MAG: hypothetical protein AB7O43_00490 [Hyphomicrobiaceae bacterium]
MDFETDEAARLSAEAFARQFAATAEDVLGPRLQGAYLLGSLAHGGFNRRYSDLDFGVVIDDGFRDGELETIRTRVGELSPFWAGRLSVFWSDTQFAVGRFPPLDRIDYLDHSIAIIERERFEPARPTLGELRAYLGGTPFENWAATALRLSSSSQFADKDHKAYVRAHLYPARFWLSWHTGRIASNDDAVEFVKRQASHGGLNVASIERALDCRRETADPVELWHDRHALLQQVEACRGLIART